MCSRVAFSQRKASLTKNKVTYNANVSHYEIIDSEKNSIECSTYEKTWPLRRGRQKKPRKKTEQQSPLLGRDDAHRSSCLSRLLCTSRLVDLQRGRRRRRVRRMNACAPLDPAFEARRSSRHRCPSLVRPLLVLSDGLISSTGRVRQHGDERPCRKAHLSIIFD